MTIDFRPLRADDADAAADIHRAAATHIPGYDMSLHTAEETRRFYRDTVFSSGPVWGAFEDGALLGFVALVPGWIEHLYVDPPRHGGGIGRGLIALAQREQDDLQLWTFQSNSKARAIYERYGFSAEECTDGARNEERQPDVRYRWRRQTVADTRQENTP